MAYMALYRKFRPAKFEDLVGQDAIVKTLLNQLESGRIAHAYLFAGPRGTGKTSCAKLFARAINCAHPVNGDPCGECEACKAYSTDDNMDIIEIDAASNNGVDNIRDIRDKVMFAPAYGKYKIYIIDEVHMLSAGAFNALLKTLEEPPKHIVFILATTEIHKLPATILSRCQRFDFRLIPLQTITDRLSYVLKESGASFEDAAIELIAKSASGGMRDALSLADVCLSYCGSTVTAEDAMSVLGISDRSLLFSFAEKLLASDASGALRQCSALEEDGKDIGVFISELMEHFRDLLLCLHCPDSPELNALPQETRKRLRDQAEKASSARLLRGIDVLSALEGELKLHNRPDILLESAVVKICMPASEQSLLALEDRLHMAEEKIAQGISVPAQAPRAEAKAEAQTPDLPPWEDKKPQEPAAPAHKAAPAAPARAASSSAPAAPKAVPAPGGDLMQMLVQSVKQNDLPLYLQIRNFQGVRDGDRFVMYIPEAAAAKEPLVQKFAPQLVQILEKLCGEKLRFETVVGSAPASGGNSSDGHMKAALDLFS